LGARQEACDGGFADLGMDLAIILILHPGLRRLVENRKCEIGDILQHGDEPPLDRPPKRLLLGILIRMWPATYVSVCGAAQYVAQSRFSFSSRGADVLCATYLQE